MHIMIRYELERQIMAGDLKVANSSAWNAAYKETLGVDVRMIPAAYCRHHWSGGMFGCSLLFHRPATGADACLMEKDLPVFRMVEENTRPHRGMAGATVPLRAYNHPDQVMENWRGAPLNPLSTPII